MCGRVSSTSPAVNIAEFFMALTLSDTLAPRYNITPSQPMLVVRDDRDRNKRTLSYVLWGLIPSWAKDPNIASKLSNARAETIHEKPSFRNAYRYRRCIIPIDGFYEWKRSGKTKQPWYFKYEDDAILAFAGLWEHWMGPNGEEMESCTIITCAANDTMSPIHHRMPVILRKEDFDLWLDPSVYDQKLLSQLLVPSQDPRLTCYPVSTYVNYSANDGPQCLEPLPEKRSENDGNGQLELF